MALKSRRLVDAYRSGAIKQGLKHVIKTMGTRHAYAMALWQGLADVTPAPVVTTGSLWARDDWNHRRRAYPGYLRERRP
ncbi:hypothetical protein [Ruegeria profundi]|uniref:Uncharacterized protein n=1 Tax=Ruegeria profundi TaxID=1685378 RepID=A0A0X3U218_9RHOB|nr:hypothetical protein [Ruegeria profundi]KUJ81291.1 hypothetical protein AVO44_05400 [Ruegeria profundi]